MTWIIDSHEDMAWNALVLKRDYRRSAVETRRLEQNTQVPQWNGDTLLGYPEYQQAQVALIFGTLFMSPRQHRAGDWEWMVFSDTSESRKYNQMQVDAYRRLCESAPDMFRLVRSKGELDAVLLPWEKHPADFPTRTYPTGILMLMEGAEGIDDPNEMEEWWQAGVRICGPVWAGTRYCGGTKHPGAISTEGFQLLDVMARLGYILDISHMSTLSVLQALDHYSGTVVATHANARSQIVGVEGERHLTDEALHLLIQRDGVVGVIPFNHFLHQGWQRDMDRNLVMLDMVAAQIDYICQLAGDARHVGIGTDFDGGFGYPEVPLEMNTIADLPKLAPLLAARGFSQEDIAGIFGGNWRRILASALPEG
jgi:membrane dipeptidase